MYLQVWSGPDELQPDEWDESTYELLPGGALHVSGQAGFAPREIIYSAAAWHRLYVYDEGPGSRPG
jgi:hypothetical protein